VSDLAIVGVTVLVMLVGLVGVVVPVLPGVFIVGVAGIVSTFALGIDSAGWALVVVLGLLTVVGAGASVVLPARRGVRGEAARSSLLLALLGGVVGFFFIPVAGIVVGAVGALYLAEAQRTGDRQRALTTTREVLIGYGIGVLVEFGIALLLIVIYLAGTAYRL
jgi:uncharacterized protein